MRLDTSSSLRHIKPDSDAFKNALVAATRYSQDRTFETKWAQKLRFLTPMIESLDPSTQCNDPQSNAEEVSPSDTDSVHDSLDTGSCICNTVPAFKRGHWRLRLIEQGEVEDCVHYLAVSYCLDSTLRAVYDGQPYSISTATGVRACRCPPALLERVIAYAEYLNYSLVWIDQECIDQHNAADKQHGIHSMDLVYQGAAKSVAVLEIEIQEQRLIDALNCLCEAIDLDEETLPDLIEAIEFILGDPWFGRAWTLQESTSGNRSMILMMRYSLHLQAPYSLWLKDGNLELELSLLHTMLSSWLPTQLYMLEDSVSADVLMLGHNLVEKWFGIMVPDVQRVDEGFYPDERTTCNAAEALSYLSPRKNTIISDRLAILANLCKYDIRLDLMAVD